MLKALLGQANVAGPTLSGLGTNFGMAPLIGKPLAVISDARLSGRADQHLIAERILSVTGEDLQTIDRKHRDAWTGTLPTRFLILTNELPRITDASGAMTSRFIMFTLEEDFYGREDHGLTGKLLKELPGILLWAMSGLDRLKKRGHFRQPTRALEAIQDMEDLGSPIHAFVRDRCDTTKAAATIDCEALFIRWKAWCETHGRGQPGTTQTFARDLRAVVPRLKTRRPRDPNNPKKRRPRQFIGIKPSD